MLSDNDVPVEKEKDYTRWFWAAAVFLLIVFVIALSFMGPARPKYSYVRARHILMKSNTQDPAETARVVERLRELRQRILNGEDFGKLARDYSEDEYSAPRGGDLGFAKKGTYTGAIEDYLWEGPIGEISDVIRSSYGYHIVQITERRLSDVEKHLKEQEKMLKERKITETLDAHAQSLKDGEENQPGTSESSRSTSGGSE